MNVKTINNRVINPHVNTSDLLLETLDSLREDSVSVSTLFSTMEHRSFGGVILLLSIVGLMPGISVLAGATIFVLGFQIMAGYETPRLPGFISSRKLSVPGLRKAMIVPINQLRKLEHAVRPRWPFLTTVAAFRTTGLVITILAVVMITPFPLSNILPAIALLLISLGLLEDDGFLIFTGLFSSIFALFLGAIIIDFAYSFAIAHFFDNQ